MNRLVQLMMPTFAASTFLDLWLDGDCSGPPDVSVDMSNSSAPRCENCWDRCAANSKTGYNSLKVRGEGAVAINGNCFGSYAYPGGWSSKSLGGVWAQADGCKVDGGAAYIMCDGKIDGPLDDLHEVCGKSTPQPPDDLPAGPFYVRK